MNIFKLSDICPNLSRNCISWSGDHLQSRGLRGRTSVLGPEGGGLLSKVRTGVVPCAFRKGFLCHDYDWLKSEDHNTKIRAQLRHCLNDNENSFLARFADRWDRYTHPR